MKKSKNLIPYTKIIYHPEGLTEYRLRTETFRQFLQVFVWDIGEKKHRKFFKSVWLTEIEYNLSGFYTYQVKGTNIIRLRSWSLNTLVHELTHFVAHQCVVINCDFTEEIPAYIMEEVFSKLMILSRGRFKVVEEFYLEWNYLFTQTLIQKQILEQKINSHSHTHKILDFLWVFFWYSQILAFFVDIKNQTKKGSIFTSSWFFGFFEYNTCVGWIILNNYHSHRAMEKYREIYTRQRQCCCLI